MGQAKLRKKKLGQAYGRPTRMPSPGMLWQPVGEVTPAVLRLRDKMAATRTNSLTP
jgi:hypothetical protein